MLQDHQLFAQLCENRGISAPIEISDAIKIGSATGELRLSCLSIMVPICEIIGQMLASSSTIKIVDLSDCMLLSKGLSSILNALCEGSSVTTLYLKGNNINGTLVSQLGQVFMHNNTLKQLHLEWNSIGSHVESFATFCEGLTKNHNIEELDLRYNQISPYCAEYLSKLIRWNKSLRNLDLSWNTLGLQGGKLISEAMRENRSIVVLALRGNCIPEDIVQKIEKVTHENRCRRTITDANLSKSVELAKKVAFKETEKLNEDTNRLIPLFHVSRMSDKPMYFSDCDGGLQRIKSAKKKKRRSKFRTLEIEKSKDDPRDFDFASDSSDSDVFLVDGKKDVVEMTVEQQSVKTDDIDSKIKELNQMLQDRSAAIEVLTAEMTAKTTEVETVKTRMAQLQVEIDRLKQERENFDAEKAKETEALRRSHKEAEDEWKKVYKELETTYEKCLQSKKETEAKVRRYERDIHKSSVENSLLKDKLVTAIRAYEDAVLKDKTEMHRIKRETKERENRSKIEQNLLKNALKETNQALEECQAQLQKSRTELRELHESQAALKARLNETEHVVARHTRLEESFQKLKEEKEALEEKFGDAQRVSSALQRQVASLQSELIEPQRRYDLLKEELDQEKQKNERLKQELSDERARLKDQNFQIEKLTQQITALNAQLNEIQNSHTEVLRERNKEKKQLKEIVAQKERELSELRADEVQRAGQLYAAFSKYLGSIGPNPVL